MKKQWLMCMFPLLFACQEVEQPKTVLTQEQWKEVKANILTEAPTPKFPVGANFENKIELIGFDVDTPLEAGKRTTFTFYWKVLAPVDQDWKIFLHLESGGKRHNFDHSPLNGMYETSRWKKGEIIKDTYSDSLPANFPAGNATPYLGLWRGSNRMKVVNEVPLTKEPQPRVIAPTLPIRGKAGATPQKGATTPKYSIRTVDPTDLEITLDGKLDDEIWSRIPPAQLLPFGNQAEKQTTWVKMFVSGGDLFLGGHLADKNIWGTLKNRDDETWKEEVLEFFLDPDGDGKDYLELQITPHNTVFDAKFDKRLGTDRGQSREEQIASAKAWNLEGLQSAVHVDGTLDNAKDEDKMWSVELKLPLKSIPGLGEGKVTPNDTWAMNFYRFDRPKEGTTWAYGWSTEPRGDFHQIDKFGEGRIAAAVDVRRPVVTPEMIREMRKNIDLKVRPTPDVLKGAPALGDGKPKAVGTPQAPSTPTEVPKAD